MVCNERGIALVSVVLFLALLLVLAHVLAEKTWQSTRLAAVSASREQLSWAAHAGIEFGRQQLANSYIESAAWHNYLASAVGQNYPPVAEWETAINGVEVEIFLRDNPDGDDDPTADNDLKIFVLSRAVNARGTETMVESLCGFQLLNANGERLSSQRLQRLQMDLSNSPTNTFSITE